MKATFFTIFAALAASAIAAPFQTPASSSNALAQPHSAMTMKRSESNNSELLKRASNVVGANNKRADDTAESVNSVVRFLGDDNGRTDAYQDEVDAVADPASVLGKRADTTESVNSVVRFLGDDNGRTDAYQDEVDAVADPASVLGKRTDDIASVNSVIRFVGDDDAHNDAYQDEFDAVSNPAEVLG